MANFMSVEKRNTILRLLVEGNSIRSVCRLMQTNIPSVLRQLLWAGEHCRKLMDERFRNLTLEHLECDEIWTFVQKKQARLTVDERAFSSAIGDMYLWTAVDKKTKLVAAHLLGKRTGDTARRFMVLLASRLKFPTPHDSDSHAFGRGGFSPITQISADAFPAYPEAVDLAFGAHARFGTIRKEYRNRNEPGRYAPPEIVASIRRLVFGMMPGEESTICTSHVERHNLTIRTFMRRFTRLSLGFSKKRENLEAASNLFIAYYNFCWRPGKLRVTPAMAAGITRNLWSFNDLLSSPFGRVMD